MVLSGTHVSNVRALGRLRRCRNARRYCRPRWLDRPTLCIASAQRRGVGSKLLQVAQREFDQLPDIPAQHPRQVLL
jgi:hypothetical protein